MPMKTCSAFSLVSLVNLLACVFACHGWVGHSSAAEPQPAPLTIERMENLMLPPSGWKKDVSVLREHFWTMYDSGFSPFENPPFIIYPFWPAFFEIDVRDGRVEQRSPGEYKGALGALLHDALHSRDTSIQKRSRLWLRQNLTLYFAGFRLSRLDGSQRPYAPWIKTVDARILDEVADSYLAAQKAIFCGKDRVEVTCRVLTDWMKHPASDALTDIVGYYDMLNANYDSISVEYVYPVSWAWTRVKNNRELFPYTSIDHDVYDLYARRLLPGSLPDSSEPVCLWLRDVYLAYIAGKELLEGKRLRLKNAEDEALLQEALRQWWAALEEQQPKENPAKSGAATKKD